MTKVPDRLDLSCHSFVDIGITPILANMRHWNWKHASACGLIIDLERFTCGVSHLGEPVDPADYFARDVIRRNVFADPRNGIEIEGARGLCESVFITLERFRGQFVKAGESLSLNAETKVDEVASWFGPPYWTDRSDGEILMFYEYRMGVVELQFEFEDGKNLSHVTLAMNGVLSDEGQRAAYGVTRSWPPKDGDGEWQPTNLPDVRPEDVEDCDGAESSRHLMPIWLHVVLDTVIYWTGAILLTLVVVRFAVEPILPIIPIPFLGYLLVLFVAAICFRIASYPAKKFRRVAARCRKCAGPAYSERDKPVCYRCRHCGFLNTTNVWRS